jgi:hypothetical protein
MTMAAIFSTNAAPLAPLRYSAMTRPLDEDTPDSEIAQVLPAKPHERWLDLCLRLIILLLAAIWLMIPPAADDARPLSLTTAKEMR